MSQLATRSVIASASNISPGVGAPYDVPLRRRGGDGRRDRRVGVAEDDRAVALHQIDVAPALDVPDVRALGAVDDVRRAADGLEGSDAGVDAAGDDPAAAFEELGVGAHCCVSANQRARYVRITSAPARLIAVRCSTATVSWSIQPFAAAAFSIAYSPLTWYAADRHVDVGAHRGDHVEVRQRRLDHHHVGTLGEVGVDLDQRLAGVAKVLLVALAVAAAGDLHVDCVAERAVQAAGVLGRVGQDRRRGEAGGVERAADGADLAVHHPAGGHDVGAGGGLGDGDPAVDLERGVVVDGGVGIVGRSVEHAAMAVIGVLVDAQIGHQDHPVADVRSQICQAQLHNSLRVEGFRADGILSGRHPEQDHGANAEVGQLLDLGAEALACVLHDARQRHDRLRFVDALAHEQRRHEIGDVEAGLGDEVPQGGRCSQSSGT